MRQDNDIKNSMIQGKNIFELKNHAALDYK
jgi:hypothetical protein